MPLLVFAKPPRAGLAKTRLAERLGSEGAAELARAFFEDTWARVAALGWARPVLVTTDPDAAEWRELGVRRTWRQSPGDLGERLTTAFRRALADGAPAALAIGADSPGLPVEILEAARSALQDADAVLGPSTDGGFYLLGLKSCEENLLSNLPWSTGATFDRTRDRLVERGLRVAVLPTWFDVDLPEDLAPLGRRLDRGEISAPATARALARRAPRPPRISVVVPALDEEARIEATLSALVASGDWHEVILVDGGSRDSTVERARRIAGVRILEAPRGRARQMNAGARAATGDVILFLHADVGLPPDARPHIARTLEDPGVVAGAFRTWTVPDAGGSWIAPLLHLGDLRSRYSGLPYGDQAVFVRAGSFERVGGFPDQPLMEDLELARRLRRAGRIRIVPASVRVSGRRFLARPVYYFLLVNLLPLIYALGVPADRLARLYGDPR